MHRIAPFALLAALLATAGSGLAVIEAIGETAALVQGSADSTLNYGAQMAADVQEKANATRALAEFVLAGSVPAQRVLRAVESVPTEPAAAWTLVRGNADEAFDAALGAGDLGIAVAENLGSTVEAVAALELGALSQTEDLAGCAGSDRPLACAEDFVHTIVEA